MPGIIDVQTVGTSSVKLDSNFEPDYNVKYDKGSESSSINTAASVGGVLQVLGGVGGVRKIRAPASCVIVTMLSVAAALSAIVQAWMMPSMIVSDITPGQAKEVVKTEDSLINKTSADPSIIQRFDKLRDAPVTDLEKTNTGTSISEWKLEAPNIQSENSAGSTQKITIYVYDTKELTAINEEALQCYIHFNELPLWRDEQRPDRAQDAAEIWLHAYFLQHQNRVMEPDQADLLYFPLYLKTAQHCCEKCTKELIPRSIKKRVLGPAYKVLQNSTAFQHHPERHVFACQFWQCAQVLRLHPLLQLELAKAQMLIHELNPRWMGKQDERHAIVVPYVANSWLTEKALSVPHIGKRTHILLGQMTARKDRMRRKMAKFPWGQYNSSFVLIQRSDRTTTLERAQKLAESYVQGMLDAKGCLVVEGDTPTTRRLFDAMAAGCVPVIVSDMIKKHLPFTTQVPWDRIAIWVPEADVGNKGIHAFHEVPCLCNAFAMSLLLFCVHVWILG